MEYISPADATLRLSAYRLPTLEEAADDLRTLLERGHFLALYQHYFPRKFKTSEGRKRKNLRQMEAEFLELVDSRLFPIYPWVLDELEPDERLEWIPIAQVNHFRPWDIESEIAYSENATVSPSVRVFAALITEDLSHWEEIEEQIGAALPRPIPSRPDGAPPRIHDWNDFMTLCREAGGRMAHVPEAIDVIGHDTGNFWIDFDEEYGWDSFPWNIQTMDELIKEAKKSHPILRRFHQTTQWLDARPERLAQVIRLWDQSLKEVIRESHDT